MPKPVFACSEQMRLRERQKALIAAYGDVVKVLDSVSSYGDFVETYERAEGVRLLFDRARAELLNHVRDHGCEVANETST